MTAKFDEVFRKYIVEASVYSSNPVGGSSVGGSVGGNQQTNQGSSGTKGSYAGKKILNNKPDPQKFRTMISKDYSKEDNTIGPDQLNSTEYVQSVANSILSGKAIHPAHLSNLAGVLEANPEMAKDLKTKGLTGNIVNQSFAKTGGMGANAAGDRALQDRFKRVLG